MADSSRVYIVLPKYSAYELKDLTEQLFYQRQTLKWVEELQSLGINVYCFAEDTLAVKLLKDNLSIKWETVLGQADDRYVSSHVSLFPREYFDIPKVSCHSSDIRESCRKIGLKFKTGEMDDEQYSRYRLDVFNSRIRQTVNSIINKENVIYFNANHNFCNEPGSEMGDGRFVVLVNVDNDTETYTYGGLALTRQQFYQILRGVQR